MSKTKLLDKSFKFKNAGLLLVFATILFVISFNSINIYRFSYRQGEIVKEDIKANKNVIDEITTNELKEKAKNKVEDVYKISEKEEVESKNNIGEFLELIRKIKYQDNVSIDQKLSLVESNKNLIKRYNLSSEEIKYILRMDYQDLLGFENNLYGVISKAYETGIHPTKIGLVKNVASNHYNELIATDQERIIGLKIINANIKSNLYYDANATNLERERAVRRIEDVLVKENELIIEKGSKIGEREIEILKSCGLYRDKNEIPYKLIVGIFIIVMLIIAAMYLYIKSFLKSLFKGNKLLILMIITITTILISVEVQKFSTFLMPIGIMTILIAMLIDMRLAIIMSAMTTLYIAFLCKLDNVAILTFLFSSVFLAMISKKQDQRKIILLNGIIIGVINLFVLLSINIIKGIDPSEELWMYAFVLVNGPICSVIALGTFPIWENIFKILTPFKLLELSNPNQALLKRLITEAPGTYHHSVLVANLAELGVEAVEGDSLFARVAAYYHDIGKIERPLYFSENQFGTDNPHDKLQPMQSYHILAAHTTDGQKLAREYKLPKELIEIMEEHHGSTLIAYFYHKAKESMQGIEIDKNEFRYKGRKPQTKESAVIMLADSCEAAVRSIKDISVKKIEDMVENVIKTKIDDEQLNECGLTFQDINRLKKVFVKFLSGVHHDRIEYPREDLKE